MAGYHKILILILIVIFIIPSSCAITDYNLTESEDNTATLALADEDVLQASNNYFFDSSLENDNGDGTIQNPYKYLTADRIKGNCNIYLSDGEYELDSNKTIEQVKIFGSNPQKTIIKYDGVGFEVNTYLTLTNLTLMDMSITNHGSVNAINTNFYYAYGSKADNYGNNYGGAIYTDYKNSKAEVNIDNCIFKDNYAVYGGAIYMGAGYLKIINSQFINNYAYNFGGAVACEYATNVSISKSKFIKDYTIDDAGGAIYIKSSDITIEKSDFINCSATFGGALTTLNSNVKLNLINVYNNSAKWDGGAIYHMYGKFFSTNGKFINNTAMNGGGLYIDNSSEVFMISNSFENNYASVSAGGIFSLLNYWKFRITANSFKNNQAPINKDYFDSQNLNVTIGNSNYTLYTIEDNEITIIPSYYSLIDEGYMTSVKDQQSSGNCWAFTAMAVLESCLKKATGKEFDLSEENMKNLIALYSDYGWKMDTNEGGYDSMPFGYFASWLGPVDEMSDVFDDNSVLSPVLNSILHIQNIILLKRNNFTDNDAIKKAIMKYGAVGTSIYFDNYYLNNGKDYFTWALYPSNHAVTIVGWDDSYSRDNFYFGSYAQGDGAWIVKNSWGSGWGDNGYFYVSYYDESFAKPGVEGIAYTFVLNDTVKFDKNYQYDIAGKTDYLHDDRTEVWYKNRFIATDFEMLKGVSTYFEKLTDWTVSVYVNDVLKTTKKGTSDAGYFTILLDDIIPLYTGDIFEIVFNTSSNNLSSVPISEIASLNKAIYYPEISYVSYDGVNWQDLFYLSKTYALHNYKSQVACIKAFTQLVKFNTTVTMVVDGGNLIVGVSDQFKNPVRNGIITLNNHTYALIDGKISIPLRLADGVYNFDACYSGDNYNNSKNDLSIEIVLNIFLPSDNVYTLNSNYKIVLKDQFNIPMAKKKVLISLGNRNYEKESSENGEISLNIDLNPGKYKITVTNPDTNESVYGNISVVSRISGNKNIVMYYGADKKYSVRLYDDYGRAVCDEKVLIKINAKLYSVKSDRNGFAYLSLKKFLPKVYTVSAEYRGFKVLNKITVKSTLTAKNKSVKKGKIIRFKAKLVSSKGKALKGKKIVFKIKGKKYTAKTNRKGVATVKIRKLSPGRYVIKSSFSKLKISNKLTVRK